MFDCKNIMWITLDHGGGKAAVHVIKKHLAIGI